MDIELLLEWYIECRGTSQLPPSTSKYSGNNEQPQQLKARVCTKGFYFFQEFWVTTQS